MRRRDPEAFEPLEEPFGDDLTDDERAVLADPSVWATAERASERGGENPRRRLE
ncbi:hypothetical protein ACTXMW_04920 [Brachybacterium paraconglomeratum]|uniref:hypothetical protein n=1 Tax=Brachybacterium paraconglomeratum TaxID=173362 RepID=UPI003FD65B65